MSPYEGKPIEEWSSITRKLVDEHPLSPQQIVDVVLESWEGIMKTKIAQELQIGVDVFPSPQIMGNYLHELIPVILAKEKTLLFGEKNMIRVIRI